MYGVTEKAESLSVSTIACFASRFNRSSIARVEQPNFRTVNVNDSFEPIDTYAIRCSLHIDFRQTLGESFHDIHEELAILLHCREIIGKLESRLKGAQNGVPPTCPLHS